MPKAPLRILIVAALCVLALIGLVARETMARAAGTEVLLAMEAVDPRSLLSGHYVIVGLSETLPDGENCPPGTLDAAASDSPETPSQPSDRWLALRRSEQTHVLAGHVASREAALALGAVAVLGDAWCMPPAQIDGGAPTVRLDVGINRFYVNQADAERIDRMLRSQTPGAEQRVFAIVSIGRDGRARLKGLNVNGEIIELTWF